MIAKIRVNEKELAMILAGLKLLDDQIRTRTGVAQALMGIHGVSEKVTQEDCFALRVKINTAEGEDGG